MNKHDTFIFLTETAAELTNLAKNDYQKGDYEATQSRLTQVSILLDRMRAITRDTAAGID